MMDTDAIYRAACDYGTANYFCWHSDASDILSDIKRLLNEADAERQELLAINERLVDEVNELKAKLTDKASLLRGCYARIDKLEKALRELHDATRLVSIGHYDQEAHDIAVSRALAALEKNHERENHKPRPAEQ